jgi:hypothetical protein
MSATLETLAWRFASAAADSISDASCGRSDRGRARLRSSSNAAISRPTTCSHGASSRWVSSLVWETLRRRVLMRMLVSTRRATSSSSLGRGWPSATETIGSISSRRQGLRAPGFQFAQLAVQALDLGARARPSLRRVAVRSVAASSAGAAAMMRSAERDSSSAERVGGMRASRTRGGRRLHGRRRSPPRRPTRRRR